MDPGNDQAGREAQFRALFDASYPALLRFAQGRVHPSHAEGVVADTLVAWRRLHDVPTDADAGRAWLFGVTQRTLLDHQRGQRRQRALAIRMSETASVSSAGPAGLVSDDTAVVSRRIELAAVWPQLSPTRTRSAGTCGLERTHGTRSSRGVGHHRRRLPASAPPSTASPPATTRRRRALSRRKRADSFQSIDHTPFETVTDGSTDRDVAFPLRSSAG